MDEAKLKAVCPQTLWLANLAIKGTSHDSIFQFSLFSTLADIFAV